MHRCAHIFENDRKHDLVIRSVWSIRLNVYFIVFLCFCCSVVLIQLLKESSMKSVYRRQLLIYRDAKNYAVFPLHHTETLNTMQYFRYTKQHVAVCSFFLRIRIKPYWKIKDKPMLYLFMLRFGRPVYKNLFQNVTSSSDLIARLAYYVLNRASNEKLRVILLYKKKCFKAKCPVEADVVCILWYGQQKRKFVQVNNVKFKILPGNQY